ncbi:MAG: ABC transporter substrate-binding protein [Patescibacteria group bacterium]
MPGLSSKTRRIKFWWHLTLAYIKRYQLRIASFILFVLAISYLSFKLAPNVLKNNLVSIGYVGTYTLETVPADSLSLATQPLISKDKSGRSISALASHWTIAEDGKTYIVFLKDNLKWHDGTTVEAKDISLAISNVDITALNNKTIQFKLPNPISSFPQALDTPVFKSKSFYGTGDFRIVNIVKVDSVIKKIVLHPKNEGLARVEIKFYPTEDLAIQALKIGEIKVLSAANVKALENWPNLNVKKELSTDEVVTIFYNNRDETLANKDLRQALSFAINRESFDGQLALGPLPPTSWAYNPSIKKYDYNIGKAKELFAKSETKNKKITLSYTQDLESVAKEIKDGWQNLGLEVELKEEKGVPKTFQALLAINKIPPDPDQYALWHSTQKDTNITKYANVKIDKLLEDARVAQKEDERKKLYDDFQRFLVEDAPATFLYTPYKYKVNYKNIEKHLANLPQS